MTISKEISATRVAAARGPARRGTPGSALQALLPFRQELLDQVRFEDSRWHLRLPASRVSVPGVELWLLSWLPGQESPLHDHGGASGAFTVLTGTVDETVVTPAGQPRGTRRWTCGPVRTFGPQHIHRVGNDSHRPAASLHAYRPALHVMRRFSRTDTGLAVVSTEHVGADW